MICLYSVHKQPKVIALALYILIYTGLDHQYKLQWERKLYKICSHYFTDSLKIFSSLHHNQVNKRNAPDNLVCTLAMLSRKNSWIFPNLTTKGSCICSTVLLCLTDRRVSRLFPTFFNTLFEHRIKQWLNHNRNISATKGLLVKANRDMVRHKACLNKKRR